MLERRPQRVEQTILAGQLLSDFRSMPLQRYVIRAPWLSDGRRGAAEMRCLLS
jgi:hypothetical protein